MMWQSMETAPKDGTKIDLLYPYPRGRTINCFWREDKITGTPGNWFWLTPKWDGGILLSEEQWKWNCYPNMQPTAWMPSPEVPSSQTSAQGSQE